MMMRSAEREKALTAVRGRRPERRAGLAGILGTLVCSLRDEPCGTDPREALQRALVKALPLRAVRLVDSARSRQLPPRNAGACDLVRLEAPPTSSGYRLALEGRIAAGGVLDAWDMQVIEGAATLGALVHEIEQRVRAGRNGSLVRQAPDGAAPLVGSSPGMRALRERIERVARTDFTILIQGESGP